MTANRIKKLARFTLTEWKLLIVAMSLLPMVALTLRMFGFLRTEQLLSRLFPLSSTAHPCQVRKEDVYQSVRMVNIGARYGIYRANCLKKSLVLFCLLRRLGGVPKIRLGVQCDNSRFFAHSWVELDDVALVSDKEHSDQFCVLY